MFHHFHDDGQAGGHRRGHGSLSAAQLRAIIRAIGPGRILPSGEFLMRAIAGQLRDHHVCLTFDDNLMCQYDVAVPVLEEFDLTAFWFVCTSVMEGNIERPELYRHFRMSHYDTADDFYAAFFVWLHESKHWESAERALRTFDPRFYLASYPFYTEGDRRFRFIRDEVLGPGAYSDVMNEMLKDAGYDVRAAAKTLWMSDAEVRSLHDAGHVIGLHSHTHPMRLSRLSDDEQRYEYRANHAHLTALLGEPPQSVSHPCNSYDDRTMGILRELDVRLGFRANAERGFDGPLELSREHHATLLNQHRAAA
jgi:peptidoglycan/xylan/chitin deacetylase (PgdA/CDA1 family)